MAKAAESPFSGSMFDNEWDTFGGSDNEFGSFIDTPNDIDEILANAGNATNDGKEQAIDPQVLSRAGTPDSACTMPLFPNNDGDDDGDNIFVGSASRNEEHGQYDDQDQTSSSMQPPFNFNFDDSSSFNPIPKDFAPPPLRNQLHRRSVSEPPTGMPSNFHPEFQTVPVPPLPEPPITFTRSGVSLGTPKIQHGNRRSSPSWERHLYQQQPYPAHKPRIQERYQLRRANTQPGRPVPTSFPASMYPVQQGAAGYQAPSPYQVPQAMMQQPYIPSPLRPVPTQSPPPGQEHMLGGMTSRVCTPAPPPMQQVDSPPQIDPQLMLSPIRSEKKVVTIPLTVEELREMINGAIRAALGAEVRESVEVGAKEEEE